MMKKIWAAVCAAAMLMTGAALAETDVRVTALKGPTAMGMVELMNEAESGAVNGNAYDFTICRRRGRGHPEAGQGRGGHRRRAGQSWPPCSTTTPRAPGPRCWPSTRWACSTSWRAVTAACSVEDLRGKTLYASGKGATPEYALNYILHRKRHRIRETDVTIECKSEHAECLAALMADERRAGACCPSRL